MYLWFDSEVIYNLHDFLILSLDVRAYSFPALPGDNYVSLISYGILCDNAI